ncbi:MAG TPA: hypothetical protein VIA62_15605 [Thermoanaerobaculia bacterium]|jgi:hypothetical protein|nr:hypothetical protein [Thermoanaerobaculia bacterium]
MNTRPTSLVVLLSVALSLTLLGQAGAESPKTEIQGAAILDHPCGKVAVKHMGLVHAGKIEEASKLGTQEMQDGWKALPAEDRKMMSEMMKATSRSEEGFSAEIKAGGLLVVEGKNATLTVKQEHKDANGSSSETLTERFVLDGATCRLSR